MLLMSETFHLLEYTRADSAVSINREAGIIHRVKVLGEASRNPPPDDNLYPVETRKRAIRVLEGARVCIDHPPREGNTTRPYGDGNGVLRNVTEGGDGLYADFHFNPKHHLAEQICWDAENCPQHLGFSINGEGKKGRKDGRSLVEEITHIHSVDLVSKPATTKGLLEGRHMQTTVKQLMEYLKDRRPGYARALREMAEAGLMSPDATMDAPMDEPAAGGEPADHEEALKAGFKAAIHAIIDDDSLDMNDQMKKIKEILKARDKLLSTKDDSPMPDMPPAMESLKRIIKGQTLLSEARIPLSFANTKALEACRTDADLAQLVESLKGTPTVRARSSAPWTPPDAEENKRVLESKIPEKASDWAKSLIE